MKLASKHGLLKILNALIEDACRIYPELATPLSKDFESLKRRIETRGPRILFVDLPLLGKAFDKGLSSGWFYEPTGLGKLSHGTTPFTSLIRQCFSSDGQLYLDPDINVIFLVRQLCYAFKKFNVPCPPVAIAYAVSEFVLTDESLRQPHSVWFQPDNMWKRQLSSDFKPSFTDDLNVQDNLLRLALQDLNEGPKGTYMLYMLEGLQKVCDRIVSTMPSVSWEDLIPSHGPGAVADLTGKEFKYNFPSWSRTLETILPYDAMCDHTGGLSADGRPSELSLEEPLGRLLAVPKDFSKPRLITAEPTAHQYCQQAILKYLRKNFPKVLSGSVNFKSQDPQREWALEASRTGEMATVDLSSASDRLSCWTVERALRKNRDLLSLLIATRTRYVVDGTDSGLFQYLRLRKFAGQGSAVTFPIQTLIYTMIAITAVLSVDLGLPKLRDGKFNSRHLAKAARKVRVFGDDIIVPVRALSALGHILASLQLKVNTSKTHYEGHFRESCGMDAYMGMDVTPVYIHNVDLGRRNVHLQSMVDTSNLLLRAGLWHASRAVVELIPPKVRRLIPISNNSEMYALALHTFSNGVTFNGLKRFDKNLHVQQGLALQVTTRQRRVQGPSDKYLLQYFLEGSPVSESDLGQPSFANWEHGFVERPSSTLLRKEWVTLW